MEINLSPFQINYYNLFKITERDGHLAQKLEFLPSTSEYLAAFLSAVRSQCMPWEQQWQLPVLGSCHPEMGLLAPASPFPNHCKLFIRESTDGSPSSSVSPPSFQFKQINACEQLDKRKKKEELRKCYKINKLLSEVTSLWGLWLVTFISSQHFSVYARMLFFMVLGNGLSPMGTKEKRNWSKRLRDKQLFPLCIFREE